jgi:hypothetical protein
LKKYFSRFHSRRKKVYSSNRERKASSEDQFETKPKKRTIISRKKVFEAPTSQ